MKRDRVLTFACALALLHVGCNAIPENEPPDPDPPAQTEIVRIEVVPNPVAVGDTALFRVVIEDSLDERFEYRWTRSGGRFANIDPRVFSVTTDSNGIRWIAPDTRDTYGMSVRAENGSEDSLAVGTSFTVTVAEGN